MKWLRNNAVCLLHFETFCYYLLHPHPLALTGKLITFLRETSQDWLLGSLVLFFSLLSWVIEK